MITMEVLLLCDDVIREEKTGKHTVVGIFDRVHVKDFPGGLLKMCAFIRLNANAGNHNVTIRIIPPAEAQMTPPETVVVFDVKKDGDIHNIKAVFIQLPLPVPGRYNVNVIDEAKRHLGETILHVMKQE